MHPGHDAIQLGYWSSCWAGLTDNGHGSPGRFMAASSMTDMHGVGLHVPQRCNLQCKHSHHARMQDGSQHSRSAPHSQLHWPASASAACSMQSQATLLKHCHAHCHAHSWLAGGSVAPWATGGSERRRRLRRLVPALAEARTGCALPGHCNASKASRVR